MHSYRYWLVNLIFLFILSCNSRDEPVQYKVSLEKYDSLKIPIDSTIKSANYPIDYVLKDSSEFIRLLNLNNHLVTINIGTKKYTQKKLSFEGPNGVGNAETLTTKSFTDSILVKSENAFKFYLINSEGKKLQSFTMVDTTEQGKRGVYSQANSNFQFFGNQMISFLHPLINDSKHVAELDSRCFVSINLATGVSKILPFYFPKKFGENPKLWDFINYVPSYIIQDKKLITSFPASDSIYVFNLLDNSTKRYPCKSKYLHDDIKGYNIKDINDVYETHKASFAFSIIKYDSFRQIYYRFLLHPTKTETTDYALLNLTLLKSFSIQILNKNFDVIGETDIFPEGKYQFFDNFVGKNGLYISNNNPKNPLASEDEISYSIFKLSNL